MEKSTVLLMRPGIGRNLGMYSILGTAHQAGIIVSYCTAIMSLIALCSVITSSPYVSDNALPCTWMLRCQLHYVFTHGHNNYYFFPVTSRIWEMHTHKFWYYSLHTFSFFSLESTGSLWLFPAADPVASHNGDKPKG